MRNIMLGLLWVAVATPASAQEAFPREEPKDLMLQATPMPETAQAAPTEPAPETLPETVVPEVVAPETLESIPDEKPVTDYMPDTAASVKKEEKEEEAAPVSSDTPVSPVMEASPPAPEPDMKSDPAALPMDEPEHDTQPPAPKASVPEPEASRVIRETPMATKQATVIAPAAATAMESDVDAGHYAPMDVIDSAGSGAIPALPLDIVVRNDITYVTGGVGDEEMEMLREVGSDFNVQLMLAASGGAYISNAFIRILDNGGNELMTADDAGPYFYVSLPPGKYTFDVTAPQGGIKKATVTAPARGITKPIMRFTE